MVAKVTTLAGIVLTLVLSSVYTGCAEQAFTVDRITPGIGLMKGGEKVTIEGAGFRPSQPVSVYFGDKVAATVGVSDGNHLWATTPTVSAPGSVDVRVVNGDGETFVIRQGFEFMKRDDMAECVNIGRALNGKPAGPK